MTRDTNSRLHGDQSYRKVANPFAVATSVFVIALQSASGLIGHLSQTQMPWTYTLVFTGLAIAGSFGGASLIGRIPEKGLKKGFGWFVLAMAIFVLSEQIWSAIA